MKTLAVLLLFAGGLWAQEPKAEEGLTSVLEKLMGKNGGDRLFYFPTKTAPDLPTKFGVLFDDVNFESEDKTNLHGWFLKPKNGSTIKGTVVFHHGNAGSMGYHLPFVTWMVKAGYQVLMYDYRGYGKSGGDIKRKGLIEDTRAAINYAKSRKDVDGKKIISYGHSLGGAKSLAGLGERMIPGVRGVISFAGFASYEDMARKFAGQTGADLVTDDHSPRDLVEKISPVPLLIVHGDKDRTVPLEQGELLFKKAKEPKTIFRIPDGGHTRALWMNDGQYRERVLAWMEKVLA
ncbi:MAG: alpha/beta hydrolase [Akkermansiaceae bacterium]